MLDERNPEDLKLMDARDLKAWERGRLADVGLVFGMNAGCECNGWILLGGLRYECRLPSLHGGCHSAGAIHSDGRLVRW